MSRSLVQLPKPQSRGSLLLRSGNRRIRAGIGEGNKAEMEVHEQEPDRTAL